MRTVSLLSPYRRIHCLSDHILLGVSALQGFCDKLLKHSNCCSRNKTNNASTLAGSVFILLQWLKRPSGIFYYSHRFPTSSPWQALSRIRTDWVCKRAPFPSGISTISFLIFATYFTFWPVSRKWESAKWDLSIGNETCISAMRRATMFGHSIDQKLNEVSYYFFFATR